ncbi:MAG: bifunctional biotin--[acetyl-CoA-carboxylase] ligase/biotin operon repressor BirA [Gammaproteobacteria bacterium]|nr:MAG: bifunctional biotin--[acetyl-CoA-carboxylase] ligase/biotin operon repressor BirA [Gammaproteobacteria bacterium]
MTTRSAVLRLLADGGFHSGTDMGQHLGVTRAAVCKAIRSLTDAGLDIHRVTGRGYRLPQPVRPLDRRAILRHLGAQAREVRDRLTLLEETGSTNRYLLERAHLASFAGAVCLAEAQAAGRGRRGRQWVATPYHNILLSMGWRFPAGPGIVAGLSLAAGVAILRALEDYGVRGAVLKWPNDVLWQEKKLAGLLVDVQGEAAGPSLVVLGVGLNGYIGSHDAARIDQPWTDLHTITGAPVERNRLAALVVRELRDMFQQFADKGLAAFRDEWQRRHLYHGRRVRLLAGERGIVGTVEGIDAHGALLLRDARGNTRAYHSGEISLRQAA